MNYNKINKYEKIITESVKEVFLYVKNGDYHKLNAIINKYNNYLNIQDENEESIVTTLINSDEITEEKKLIILKLLKRNNVDIFLPNKYKQNILHLCLKKKYVSICNYIFKEYNTLNFFINNDIFNCNPIDYLIDNDINNLMTIEQILGSTELTYFNLLTDKEHFNDVFKNKIQNIIDDINKSWFNSKLVNLINKLPDYYYLSIFDNITKKIEANRNSVLLNYKDNIDSIFDNAKYLKTEIEKEIYNNVLNEFKGEFHSEWSFFKVNTFHENYSTARQEYLNTFFKNFNTFFDTTKIINLKNQISNRKLEAMRSLFIFLYEGTRNPFYSTILFNLDVYFTHPKAIVPRGNIIDLQNRVFIRSNNGVIICCNTFNFNKKNTDNAFLRLVISDYTLKLKGTEISKFLICLLLNINKDKNTILNEIEKLIQTNHQRQIFNRIKNPSLSKEEIYYAIISYLHYPNCINNNKCQHRILERNIFDQVEELIVGPQPVVNPLSQNQVFELRTELYYVFHPIFTLIYNYYHQTFFTNLYEFYNYNVPTVNNFDEALTHLVQDNTVITNVKMYLDDFNILRKQTFYNPKYSEIDNIINFIKGKKEVFITNDTLWTLKQILIYYRNTENIDNVYNFSFFNPIYIFNDICYQTSGIVNQILTLHNQLFKLKLILITLKINIDLSGITIPLIIPPKFFVDSVIKILNNNNSIIRNALFPHKNYLIIKLLRNYINDDFEIKLFEFGVHPKYITIFKEIKFAVGNNENILAKYLSVLYSQCLDCDFYGYTTNMVTDLISDEKSKRNQSTQENIFKKPLFGTIGGIFNLTDIAYNYILVNNEVQSIYQYTFAPSRYDTYLYNLLNNKIFILEQINYILNTINVSLNDYLKIDINNYRILIQKLNLLINRYNKIYQIYKKEIINYNNITSGLKSYINNIYDNLNDMTKTNLFSAFEAIKKMLSDNIKDDIIDFKLDEIYKKYFNLIKLINALIYIDNKDSLIDYYEVLTEDKNVYYLHNSDLNYYTTSTYFTNISTFIDLFSFGDFILGLIKEDTINLLTKDKNDYYIYNQIVTDYFNYLMKFNLNKIVEQRKKLVMSGGNIIDLTFTPRLKINQIELTDIYKNTVVKKSSSYFYKISSDFLTNVKQWDYNESFIVYDNSKIYSIISEDFTFYINLNIQKNIVLNLNVQLLDCIIDLIPNKIQLKQILLTEFENYINNIFGKNMITHDDLKDVLSKLIIKTEKVFIEDTNIIMELIPIIESEIHLELITLPLNEITGISEKEFKKYYDILSSNCILKKDIDFYKKCINKIKSIITDTWVNNLIKTINKLYTENNIAVLNNDILNELNIEDKLITIILEYPEIDDTLDIDTLLNIIKHKLNITLPIIEEIYDEKISPFYNNYARILLNDCRTIITNYMRFYLTMTLYRYTLYLLSL